MNKDLVIFLIGGINHKADRFHLEELRRHGIKKLAPSHGEIFGALLLRGKHQMTKLAEYIEKEKSTITALINKLIRMGYEKKGKRAPTTASPGSR